MCLVKVYRKLLTSTHKSIRKESLLYTLFPFPNGLNHAILSPMKSWITYTLVRPRVGPHLVLRDPQGSFLHNPQTATHTQKVSVFWSSFDRIVSQVYPKGANGLKRIPLHPLHRSHFPLHSHLTRVT